MMDYHLSGDMLPAMQWDPTGRRAQVRFNPRDDTLLMDAIRAIMEAIDLNTPWSDSRFDCGTWVQGLALRAEATLHEGGLFRNYPGLMLNYYFVLDVVSWLGHFYGCPFYYDAIPPIEMEQVPYCPGCGRGLRLMWKYQYSGANGGSIYSPIWGCPSSNSTYKEKCRPAINRVWPHRCPEFITRVGGRTIFFHDWEGDGNPIPPEYRIYPPTEWSKEVGKYIEQHDTSKGELDEADGIYLPTKPLPLMGRKSLTPKEIEDIRDTYEDEGWAGFFRLNPNRRGISKKDVQDEARKWGLKESKESRRLRRRWLKMVEGVRRGWYYTVTVTSEGDGNEDTSPV